MLFLLAFDNNAVVYSNQTTLRESLIDSFLLILLNTVRHCGLEYNRIHFVIFYKYMSLKPLFIYYFMVLIDGVASRVF